MTTDSIDKFVQNRDLLSRCTCMLSVFVCRNLIMSSAVCGAAHKLIVVQPLNECSKFMAWGLCIVLLDEDPLSHYQRVHYDYKHNPLTNLARLALLVRESYFCFVFTENDNFIQSQVLIPVIHTHIREVSSLMPSQSWFCNEMAWNCMYHEESEEVLNCLETQGRLDKMASSLL